MTMLRSLGLLVVLQTTSDAYLLNHPSFASSSSWGTSCRGASCPARRIRQTRPYYLAPPTASSSIINNTSAAVFSTDPLLFDMQKQYAELHECMEQTLQLEASSQKSTTAKQQVINRARWLLLIAAALYGTNFSCVKLLGEADIPIGASTTLRFGLAALVTLPWLVPSTRKESLRVDCPDIAATMAGLEVGMWNSMGYIAQAVGLQTTAASKSAFLCSLAVVVVPLLDAMAGKVMKSKQITGVVLALAGVAMLELGGSMQDVNFAPGDWCSLLQPLAFGMGFWRMEAAMHKYPNQALRSTAAQLFAVFVASFAYCMCAEQGAFAHTQEWLTDPTIFLGLFWTGVITTALTIYMETIALETLSAAETTLIFSTEPLFGTAFGE